MFTYGSVIFVVDSSLLMTGDCVCGSYELGSGPANVTSTARIDDGLPHQIVATRYDQLISSSQVVNMMIGLFTIHVLNAGSSLTVRLGLPCT